MTVTSWGEASFNYEHPDNLVTLLEDSVEKYARNRLFGTKGPDGVYRWITYAELGARVDAARGGLAGLGVGAGDVVGIIANNRVEWAVAAFATYGRGARFVPMYEAELPATWQYIINDSGVKVLFVSSKKIVDQIEGFRDKVPGLEHLVLIDGEGEGSLAALEAAGRAAPVDSVKPSPKDIAVLIYTSGTTGKPKGVLLVDGNFTTNILAGLKIIPELNEGMVSLSILPWAHSFGQTAELYTGIYLGASAGYVESPKTIINDIQVVRPTFLIAVPRIFNRIYAGIATKMEAEGGLKKALFDRAVKVAAKKRELAAEGKSCPWTNLQLSVLDSLVFSKIRARFGGRLLGSMTGSAAMDPQIGTFFRDIGIPVYDCYGLTETSPAVTMNGSTGVRPGSVGRPIGQVKVVIDTKLGDPERGDGEIIVYGPNVMQGYNNQPEATAAVMTEDGGFRTGDRGRIDDDGYLFITGRIKEQFKLENGKYVFPAAIEEAIKLDPRVANVMIHGDGKPHNVAVVIFDLDVLGQDEAGSKLPKTHAELAESPEALALAEGIIKAQLEGKFGKYEIPRKVALLPDDFTVDNGMLTQTLKLKRREVLKRYGDQIMALYVK